MFRFLRPPSKTFLSVSRLPIRVESRVARGEMFQPQKVRFMKRRLQPRSVALSIMTIYVSYWAWTKLFLDPIADALDAVDPDPQEEAPPLFIPLPGTTKQLPPRKYQVTDPEVRTYQRLSKIEGYTDMLKVELARTVLKVVQSQPLLVRQLGNMSVSKLWLNSGLPQYAPPVIVRTGVMITDDYIALATEPVDPEIAYRIRRALWPSGVAVGLWTFAKMIAIQDFRKAARYLGFEIGSDPPTVPELLAKQQQMSKLSTSSQAQLFGNTQTQKPTVLSGGNSDANKKILTPEEQNPDESRMTAYAASVQMYNRAMSSLRAKMRSSLGPIPRIPPAGSILTQGMIQLESPKVVMDLMVQGFWNVKTDTYDLSSLSIKVTNVRAKSPGEPRRRHGNLR